MPVLSAVLLIKLTLEEDSGHCAGFIAAPKTVTRFSGVCLR